MAMDIDSMKEFIRLDTRQAEIESELEIIKKRKAELDAIIQEDFATNGIDRIKLNGSTIYTNTRIFAKLKATKDEFIDVLKNSQYKYFLSENYNGNTMNAFVAELIRTGQGIPGELQDVLDYDKKISVRVR